MDLNRLSIDMTAALEESRRRPRGAVPATSGRGIC